MTSSLTMREVLFLALAVKARFRCKCIAEKPDAHSWSVEQDFLNGAETVLKMAGRSFHPIVEECREKKRSITTLTPSDFEPFERPAEPGQEATSAPRDGIETCFAGLGSGQPV